MLEIWISISNKTNKTNIATPSCILELLNWITHLRTELTENKVTTQSGSSSANRRRQKRHYCSSCRAWHFLLIEMTPVHTYEYHTIFFHHDIYCSLTFLSSRHFICCILFWYGGHIDTRNIIFWILYSILHSVMYNCLESIFNERSLHIFLLSDLCAILMTRELVFI